jgi:hypothetical protein
MTFVPRKAVIVSLVAVATLVSVSADVPSDLGVAAADAMEMAVQGVTAGSMPWGQAAQRFKAATAQQRVVIVKNVMAWAKTLTATPAFASAYATARDHMKPGPSSDRAGLDDQMKKQLAELDKSEAEMKKQFSSQPEMLKQMLDSLAMARKQMIELSKNSDARKAVDVQNAQAQRDDAARLARFDAEHPADVKAAIAVRLHQFLDACGDVDFAAQLKTAGSRKVFLDQRYEQKPSEWKICYRAGREPVEAARALAQEWLKELGK